MKMGVVGAGLMGREIAFVHALAGWDVVLADHEQAALDKASDILERLVKKGIQRGFYEDQSGADALARIHTTTDLSAFAEVELMVEAVYEREEVKADVLQSLDRLCRAECLFATNTSTIPISTLAGYVSAERKSRFIGTHYFSPVSRMQLVEVIPAFETSAATTDAIMRLCRDIGKAPILIKDVAGFAVIEAVKLVEEGVATPEDLDTACRLGLGHAMGPFELMDAVTADLCVEAQEIMQEAYGERFRPPALLKQRVRAGLGGGHGRPGWRAPK